MIKKNKSFHTLYTPCTPSHSPVWWIKSMYCRKMKSSPLQMQSELYIIFWGFHHWVLCVDTDKSEACDFKKKKTKNKKRCKLGAFLLQVSYMQDCMKYFKGKRPLSSAFFCSNIASRKGMVKWFLLIALEWMGLLIVIEDIPVWAKNYRILSFPPEYSFVQRLLATGQLKALQPF